jgi:hypothetical protein
MKSWLYNQFMNVPKPQSIKVPKQVIVVNDRGISIGMMRFDKDWFKYESQRRPFRLCDSTPMSVNAIKYNLNTSVSISTIDSNIVELEFIRFTNYFFVLRLVTGTGRNLQYV